MKRRVFKQLNALLAVFLLLVVAACNKAPSPEAELESQGIVLATSPTNGAVGVAKTTDIRILFSPAMNRLSTQAAFSVTGASSGVHAGVFSWNATSTVLNFNPTADFWYGEWVTVTVKKTAKDVTNKLLPADYVFKFRIIRAKRVVLTSEPALDGHVFESGHVYTDNWLYVGDTNGVVPGGYPQPPIVNQYARAFLSFNLSGLVADKAKQILYANFAVYQFDVNGNPYQEMGDLQAQGVVYGTSLENTDFALPVQNVAGATQTLATFLGGGSSEGYKSALFTTKVQSDLTNAAIQSNRSQFRLKFNGDTSPDGTEDRAAFYPGDNLPFCGQPDLDCQAPRLFIVYTYP
jgi:Bacterial Ig-like domain